jgi:tetratricopeptide (TPR) repeat protein
MSSVREEGLASYRVACEHDRNGREAEAIPNYELALELGLSAEDRRGALVGLGSSLRNVRRYADAIAVLTRAVREFPEDASLAAFLSLALYSGGDVRSAMVTLLDVVLRHAPVGEYARALSFYRDQLQ